MQFVKAKYLYVGGLILKFTASPIVELGNIKNIIYSEYLKVTCFSDFALDDFLKKLRIEQFQSSSCCRTK